MPYYNTIDCAGSDDPHVHAPCPGGRDPEFGRIRQSGFIKEGYLPDVIAGATSPSTWLTVWETGIANGDIIVLPETSGSFDPGTPAELQGFGERPSSYGQRTMVLSVNDPDYKLNYPFYNNLAQRTNLVPFYVTSSLIHIFDKPAAAYANDPVEDDLNSQVYWNFQATVISNNLPVKFAVAPISPAIKYTPSDTAITYNTMLEFSAATSDTAADITATVDAMDADIKLEFNSIASPTGTPATMDVYRGATQEMTVTFLTDYIGRQFRFTDLDGGTHTGVFQNGTVNF